MKNLVAIVIPIYKENLNKFEIISLNQCLKKLKTHPIIFIAPAHLDTAFYENYCDKNSFLIKRFDESYFESIDGYNKLMLSPNFYKAFIKYKFILIHQLDAYIFKDELKYWCRQNYDFIGAPFVITENDGNKISFLSNYTKILSWVNYLFGTKYQIKNVGNGGLSLRKTRTFYILLSILKSKTRLWGFNNEDLFFTYWGNILFPLFRLPNDIVALHFSIEKNPSDSIKKLTTDLPFGCHAFEKYDFNFWKTHIEI